MWFYLAIAAALGWTIGSIFLKKTTKKASILTVFLATTILKLVS